jgi:hypothetical protein
LPGLDWPYCASRSLVAGSGSMANYIRKNRVTNTARGCFRWRDGIVCCYNPIIEDTGHFEIPSVSWMDVVAGDISETPPLYILVYISPLASILESHEAASVVIVEDLS